MVRLLLLFSLLTSINAFSSNACVHLFANVPLFAKTHTDLKIPHKLTIHWLEHYLLNENGFVELQQLQLRPQTAAEILNKLAKQTLLRVAEAYQKPIVVDRTLTFTVPLEYRAILENIQRVISKILESKIINYQEYAVLSDILLRYHDVILKKVITDEKNFSTRKNYAGTKTVQDIQPELLTNTASLIRDLRLLEEGHFSQIRLYILDLRRDIPLGIEIDYFAYLIFGFDIYFSGISATPFLYYDHLWGSAKLFNEHDTEIHNIGMIEEYYKLWPQDQRNMRKLIQFFRSHSANISGEQRLYAGAFLHALFHEGYHYGDILDLFYSPEGLYARRMDETLNIATNLIMSDHLDAYKLYGRDTRAKVVLSIQELVATFKASPQGQAH